MIEYTRGNLLEADVEALVNTVNTVGVMGKGIALMFKEAFPENFAAYEAACKHQQVVTGRMFVTERDALLGPRWIINFPTKQHWRAKTRVEWIESGLEDLKQVIREKGIRSIALPPLGCGNGGLDWAMVRPRIEAALAELDNVRVLVFEPTVEYQNVAKRSGVERLTPARAMIAELVRRYWVLGIECSLLEVQKLAWLMEQRIIAHGLENPLKLEFQPHRYGPYSDRLRHLLNGLDGSYLHSERRINDATPEEVVWFDESRRDRLHVYLRSAEARPYVGVVEEVDALIDGFQSPLGMEVLATLDWLISQEYVEPTVEAIKEGLRYWPDDIAGQRKLRLFSDRLIALALERLREGSPTTQAISTAL
ncbi:MULTISPECIES: type II toxin-antitoxin system antitoxin DNA ADP-ribosyl glycohydrolase DarG [Halomonadaceae]|jgi:O-acetyl-ADP-ribose deacetylase (regulator of RNase III)|uniref:type II toxin-antitoxin system antitoxin DNA ADP-ribosyl glycohydrolase DarG n=1 Tax=Halomonadaceae TaxID=28256 RepID=UPI0018EFA5DE|nr:macro domain-containing protein [Halomonas sp. A40-4]QPL45923.1 macro domain-containing protein [Halomonas sp. A40-4]